MGKRVRMANGVGVLAQISGARTLYCTATWIASNRIQIRMEPLRVEAGRDGDPDAAAKWCAAYLRRLEAQMRARPQDIGFRSGHILAHRGRLKHYPGAR
jgi:lauroyl/myristoyl acyltransferase